MKEREFAYSSNISYIFIPMNFSDADDFQKVCSEFNACGAWEQLNSKWKYMLKYVADKFDASKPEQCRCFHYILNNDARTRAGIAAADEWYSLGTTGYLDNADEVFRFRILDVELFCFSTSVCIMAFKVNFETKDPLRIATAQYNLKKVSKEKIHIKTHDPHKIKTTTFLELAKRLVSFSEFSVNFDFFYYAVENQERSNMLTYVEVDNKEDYKKELFYLRRCYSDGYLYYDNEEVNARETYIPSPDTHWGITSEAVVCLVCPDKGKGEFLKDVFFKNFNTQYLFTYVLLLHQKYALYTFLSKIGNGIDNDLETLESYQQQLYEFETDFVFSYITEVPQYQNLYSRIYQAFHIDRIFKDVNEPVKSLSDVRRNDTEKKQKERDDRINRLLFAISLLSIFSMLSDGHTYIQQLFGNCLSETTVSCMQYGFLAAAVVCLIVFAYKAIKKD